jgi:hypothetical protein
MLKLNINWKDIPNQRKFFEQYAKELKFRNISEFQSLSTDKIVKLGGSFVLSEYNGSIFEGK